jgi:predicted nucleic acid-binding protein
MKDEVFYDTTILVYAHDEHEPRKRGVCRASVESVFNGETLGIISNQVLAELFSVLTTKMNISLQVDVAEKIVLAFIESPNWIKINYDHETVKRAILTAKLNKVPFWDALITETMKENGIVKIITENERDFKKIPGINVINPFKKA